MLDQQMLGDLRGGANVRTLDTTLVDRFLP